MSDDRRKEAARGAASRAHNGGEARGKGQREGGEAAHRGGDIGGEERGRSRRGRKEGRHDEAKTFGVSEWYGCSSSRVRIYIAAIL